MTIDFGSFTIVEWILSVLGILVALLSAGAAWYGAVISHKNQKRLIRRDSVVLRVTADHTRQIVNGVREHGRETVNFRILNEGRPIQIDFIYHNPSKNEQIPAAFYKDFAAYGESINLGTHQTFVFKLKVMEFLQLTEITANDKPLMLMLADGEQVFPKVNDLEQVLSGLREDKAAFSVASNS
jgi:hypothetical protein